jgi:hypothetical protein
LIDIDACPNYVLEALKTDSPKKSDMVYPDSKNKIIPTDLILKETKAEKELDEDETNGKSSK